MSERISLPAGFKPEDVDLNGRHVLITGATGGIGDAVSRLLAARGAQLILAAKQPLKLQRLAKAISNAGGSEPALYPVNLAGATLENYQELAEMISQEFGQLDAVIHLATHFKGLTPLNQLTGEGWLETMAVNLQAPFLINRAMEPLLKASPHGQILFTLDQHERTAQAYWGAYGVFQGAQEKLAKIASEELTGQDIGVCIIEPPQTETAFASKVILDRKGLASPHKVAMIYAHVLNQQQADSELLTATL